ncbi:MAG: SIMPL domain-containing protein [Acidimicrobiales bacterium]|nr:SIMPL domain-containing protein [Acidimicrobiales bacterium]MCB9393722.1 SIMPL domain-containing protein [Acidimicrobiaceae bacterium]
MTSVNVTGRARQLVPPDRAVVDLGLSVVAADAASALDQVSARSTALHDHLTGLGIEPDDWVTDGITVAEEWEYRRDQHTLVGHRATTGVVVTVADTSLLSSLVRVAVGDAGAQVRQLRWEVLPDHPVRRELLGRAALDARDRATAYVTALGLRLGAVELISESPIDATPSPAAVAAPKMRAAMADHGAELAVSGGQIELAAEVHVRFAILPSGG